MDSKNTLKTSTSQNFKDISISKNKKERAKKQGFFCTCPKCEIF